ncbi:DNA polymerase I [Bradymonas sediminis]|uniref:DNA polymerase I n=1 Tax=Bradymonas sediminis TaxID=1548548 RepID=A0A2Z4FPX7_9DELT|nr:DNA polymerase I [Bradymonas sediminis]AWV91087.1 DNA polymerase I [Bradymonas sediminis]TDP75171.1 DNA polymerase I [Bradymonas sediminis]
MSENKTLYIVDGSSYIFRAFYAIRSLSTAAGFPTNAIYGFTQMLMRLLRDENPEYIAMTFDVSDVDVPNFRKVLYDDYKANRSAMPDELREQMPYFSKVVEALHIPIKTQVGVEADDVIATLTRQARAEGFEVCIVSADKDLMQLLADEVRMLDTMRDKTYTPEEVQERFNVTPDKVKYVLALAGDSSDNIPGVPGIGEVTGGRLIEEFGDLENLLANIDKVSGKKRKENLENFADQARLSLELVTLRDDCDVEFQPEDLVLSKPNFAELDALFTELEFGSPLRDVRKWMEAKGWLEPEPEKPKKAKKAKKKPSDQLDFFSSAAGANSAAAEQNDHTNSGKNYRAIRSVEAFEEVLAKLAEVDRFAFDLETTSLNPLDAQICGMSFAWQPNDAVYIPCAHSYEGVGEQLDLDYILEKLRPFLESEDAKKVVGQHLKYEWLVLQKYDIDLRAILYDTMLMSYLLDPSSNKHGMDAMAMQWLNYQTISYEDVAGKGKSQVTFDKVHLDAAVPYGAEDADITLMLCNLLEPMLIEAGLKEIHDTLEVPLTRVLAIMEAEGIQIDPEMLGVLSVEFDQELGELQDQIDELSGGPTNPNSPKQLREVLFERLGLPVKKRTKTGPSTAASVLEELSELHELPALILEYRSFSKLKGTYVDALPLLIREDTGRIHTSFNQAVAATGRLSSSNPNLQNIPMRTARGRQIRKAFVPAPGYQLLVADYSQIELRIVAHMSQDPLLLDAYKRGADIHRLTASQIFDVDFEEVTSAQRGAGKTINFGVLYGMGARRLAASLRISQGEATQYIDNYFERYAGVSAFFDKLVADATHSGYAETMFGRKRQIADMGTLGRREQAFAERVAINTPIQGSAADIIKFAMVNLQAKIEAEELPMRMLLQVHDELVFEVEDAFVDAAKTIVREAMEGVCELDVPLLVDLGCGDNWLDAK